MSTPGNSRINKALEKDLPNNASLTAGYFPDFFKESTSLKNQ